MSRANEVLFALLVLASTACKKADGQLSDNNGSLHRAEQKRSGVPTVAEEHARPMTRGADALRVAAPPKTAGFTEGNDVDALTDLLESPPADEVELGRRLAALISDPEALSKDERERIARAWQKCHAGR